MLFFPEGRPALPLDLRGPHELMAKGSRDMIALENAHCPVLRAELSR